MKRIRIETIYANNYRDAIRKLEGKRVSDNRTSIKTKDSVKVDTDKTLLTDAKDDISKALNLLNEAKKDLTKVKAPIKETRQATEEAVEYVKSVLDTIKNDKAFQAVFARGYDSIKKPSKKIKVVKYKGKDSETQIEKTYDLEDFEPWSGAIYTWNIIQDNDKIDALDNLLRSWEYSTIDESELNDILWHDSDAVLNDLGLGEDEE